ncbi:MULTISPECIES: hypothetical protein [unclassified Caballeronia]|uniref:hypothetical protein n=1 Tax=unclassified Caballeronia TaxID=2646786 RepID=UPI0028652FC1|nr:MULTISPECIES: hypothetical protein [unclassified Caballeronia]MDR5772145.1 hypothetical protein [Caballeronia sp. LZ002]MDR5804422.1 hypothetical protein [Caballeronia sp. LZ001]MDR5847579.1 hypothetical protein [Caballeronia sp. LZ003]
MTDTNQNSLLSPEQLKKISAAAAEREARAKAAMTEECRRMAAKAINAFAKEHCQYLRDRYGADLQPSKVFVALKKPKAYYDAIFEAAALMKNDSYLLDRTVKGTIAELFPEAARRAGYKEHIPDSAWYNEFSPSLQKRINKLLDEYGATDECSSLSKVRALIRAGRKPKGNADAVTGDDLPMGRFHFNGDGTVCWFGNELTIQRKGASGTRYVKAGGKLVNIVKALERAGVTRATLDLWEKNAEAAYKRRREAEAVHDENLREWGTKYD